MQYLINYNYNFTVIPFLYVIIIQLTHERMSAYLFLLVCYATCFATLFFTHASVRMYEYMIHETLNDIYIL